MDGMDAAQARYDRAESAEQPTCEFCDGQGTVYATEVENVAGEPFRFRYTREEAAIPCPVCKMGMTLNGARLE